jgi:hypothetical protein
LDRIHVDYFITVDAWYQRKHGGKGYLNNSPGISGTVDIIHPSSMIG